MEPSDRGLTTLAGLAIVLGIVVMIAVIARMLMK